jgi:hypothetical protein
MELNMRKGHISKPNDWKKIPKSIREKGIRVEYEHTKDYKTARRIMSDHIMEMGPRYYDELEKLEGKLAVTRDREIENMMAAAETKMMRRMVGKKRRQK